MGRDGCLWWTSIIIRGWCGRTSNWLAPPVAHAKHRIAPSVRLVGPSIVLGEPANCLGSCSSTFWQNHQPPHWPLPLQPPPRLLPLPLPLVLWAKHTSHFEVP
ncbi:hypothetical protein Tco_0648013 [Tanacetum coccineum]